MKTRISDAPSSWRQGEGAQLNDRERPRPEDAEICGNQREFEAADKRCQKSCIECDNFKELKDKAMTVKNQGRYRSQEELEMFLKAELLFKIM